MLKSMVVEGPMYGIYGLYKVSTCMLFMHRYLHVVNVLLHKIP